MMLPPQLVQMMQQAMQEQPQPGFSPYQPQPLPQPIPLGLPGGGWQKGNPSAGSVLQPSAPFSPMLRNFGPLAPFMRTPMQSPQPLSMDFLRGLFSMGSNSAGMGARGPAPNPFLGLQKFMGPFGNGGGRIMPQPVSPFMRSF